ncbi:MAG: MFS transporter [Candidatus Latescibacterota bacterium]
MEQPPAMNSSTKPTDSDRIRGLPWALAHETTNSVFTQLTVFGPIFLLFLNELGLPKVKIGFLLSLMPFCGLLAPFIASMVARAGIKRVFIIFWALRKVVVAFFLLTPWVMTRFGTDTTFLYVALLVGLFALFRAIGETGFYPWWQEIIPPAMRGKYSGVSVIVTTLGGCGAIGVASWMMGRGTELDRFLILMVIGVVFGLISVGCVFPIPGGAKRSGSNAAHFRGMRKVLEDRNFLRYLGGIGLTTMGMLLFAFVPLFMKEQVGLSDSQIVLLQIGSYAGGVLSSYVWGWTSDRYGSKPVMLSSIYGIVALPVCWALMPRHSDWSNSVAMAIAFLGGVAGIGWMISNSRMLYVRLFPSEKKTEYTAIYYAWIGLVGGLGPLMAGQTLDLLQDLEGRFWIFDLNAYTPLFAASVFLLLAGRAVLAKIHADGAMQAGELMGMFLQGNPFLAVRSLVQYRLAQDERSRVVTTERLGTANSPLNVEELLEALADPSFIVRYEAIISIARTRSDKRLVDALLHVLGGKVPDLSTAAAWALGRIGDPGALPLLRETLESDYPLLRAYSARSLAQLGDTQSVPHLVGRLRTERDDGLRMAYASALGMLEVREIVSDLLDYLRITQEKGARAELALALARLIGCEGAFVRLWRKVDHEPGTAFSQNLRRLHRPLKRLSGGDKTLRMTVEATVQALAEGKMDEGARLLGRTLASLPLSAMDPLLAELLREYAARLEEGGDRRMEYLVVALVTLEAAIRERPAAAPAAA